MLRLLGRFANRSYRRHHNGTQMTRIITDGVFVLKGLTVNSPQ